MSLTFPRRWLAPVAAAAALGLAATPALADQARHREWWLSAIHVTTAWRTTRGGGVTVAVLGSGVDPAQPDLAGSVEAGPDFTRTGESSGSLYWGSSGTATAALIAGHGHGRRRADGTMGIAPAARILSVRVVPDRRDPALADPAVARRLPGSIAAGIRYAAAHGATVIDLPLDPGATDAAGRDGAAGAGGGSAAERAAVRYALGKGAVLVAPAGDDREHGGAVNYPAAYPGVIAVGAFDRNFDLAHFSSRRPYVTVTGPGVDMVTARSGGYTTVTSTAAASAVVAGVAALVRAEYPRLRAAQVTRAVTRGTLFRHAKRPGSGYGAADAAGALRAAAAFGVAPGRAPASPAGSPSASRQARAPAGSPGIDGLLRDGIAAAVAALLMVLLALLVRAVLRRRRSGSPLQGPAPDSPLSGGLSGPAATATEQGNPLGAPPGPRRRPKLGPVTGLPLARAALPAAGEAQPPAPARPPWEDAPMPEAPAPGWPAEPLPGWPGGEWPGERLPGGADAESLRPGERLPGGAGAGSPWPAPHGSADPPGLAGREAAPGWPGGGIHNGQPGPAGPGGAPARPAWPDAGRAQAAWPGAGAGPGGRPVAGWPAAPGEAEGEDTQAFPPLPSHNSGGAVPAVPAAAAVPDDPLLDDEDVEPLDDEDDRHL